MLKCALPCFKENKRVQKQDHVVVLCVTGFFPHVLLPHFEIDTPTSPFYNCGSLLLRMMKHCSVFWGQLLTPFTFSFIIDFLLQSDVCHCFLSSRAPCSLKQSNQDVKPFPLRRNPVFFLFFLYETPVVISHLKTPHYIKPGGPLVNQPGSHLYKKVYQNTFEHESKGNMRGCVLKG